MKNLYVGNLPHTTTEPQLRYPVRDTWNSRAGQHCDG